MRTARPAAVADAKPDVGSAVPRNVPSKNVKAGRITGTTTPGSALKASVGLDGGCSALLYGNLTPSSKICSLRIPDGASKPREPATAMSSSTGISMSKEFRSILYTPSASTPMPPTREPFLYSGIPPGSPASPSGKGGLFLISVHGRLENCTPKSGPLATKLTPTGRCSWMMSLAVRVEKAFPLDDKKAPVPALEIAARVAGTRWPSKPQMLG